MVHLCVTTTGQSDWREKIRDLDRLGEKAVSVYPTVLKFPERQEMYEALLASGIKHIPHVHLRGDMSEEEADFFIENFKTEVFTIHAADIARFFGWEISQKLFVEFNYSNSKFDLENLNKFGGFCVDLCHFYRARERKTAEFGQISEGVKKYRVGCNHISGITPDEDNDHFITDIRQFDYLDELPDALFSPYPCLEVENGIADQLRFREYIIEKLRKRGMDR